MAAKSITKKKAQPVADKTTGLREINKIQTDIKVLFDKLEPKDQLKALEMIGCASDYYTCQCCNKVKKKSDFYVSTEPSWASGITRICK